jgi:hypothetical protein
MDFICIAYGGSTNVYPTGTNYPSDGSDSMLEDFNLPAQFLTEGIETGMYVDYYATGGSPMCFAPLTNVGQTVVQFPDKDLTVETTYDYHVDRNPGLVGYEEYIYKAELLIKMTAATYNDFFLTSPDIINVKLTDISEYINLHYRFVLFSNNHRIKSAKIDFLKDSLALDLVEVS